MSIARFEVRNKERYFLDKLVSITGLTKHQLRHRRGADVYPEYLQLAQEELALEMGCVTSAPMGGDRPALAGLPAGAEQLACGLAVPISDDCESSSMDPSSELEPDHASAIQQRHATTDEGSPRAPKEKGKSVLRPRGDPVPENTEDMPIISSSPGVHSSQTPGPSNTNYTVIDDDDPDMSTGGYRRTALRRSVSNAELGGLEPSETPTVDEEDPIFMDLMRVAASGECSAQLKSFIADIVAGPSDERQDAVDVFVQQYLPTRKRPPRNNTGGGGSRTANNNRGLQTKDIITDG